MAEQVMNLSRRNFLKGMGAGAIGLSAGTWFTIQPALAQTGSRVTAFSRFNVGDFEVTAIQDAVFPFDPAIFAANADAADLAALLTANNLPSGGINATVTVLLVNTGSDLILLDTGNGAANGGSLLPTLELLGIGADAITGVIISHFHPDHIGGLSADGASVFPNAMVYFPQVEWDFMQSNATNGTVMSAQTALQPAIDAGKITYYAPDGEILAGFTAVPAPGHTAGHSAILIGSGDDQLLNLVDSSLNNVVSLARTDWYAGFDADPELASTTRRALLTSAAEAGTKVFGYHFAFPGIGYVVAAGEGFEFVSVTA